MSAVDLLFGVNDASERLHQLALAALFKNTRLLEVLGVPGNHSQEVEWEPLRKLYDLAIPSEDPAEGKVYVEIKVDDIPHLRQWTRQIVGVQELGSIGQFLYFLLGVSEIAYSRGDVEEARSLSRPVRRSGPNN